MITDVVDYIRERGQVPLRDLALHLGIEESILEGMLERLIRKGRIRELPAGTACGGGCQQCSPEKIRIFAWTEENTQPQ